MTGRTALACHVVLATCLDEAGAAPEAADLHLAGLMSDQRHPRSAGRMTVADVREILGFEVLDQVDGSLKAHGMYEPYTVEDVDQQVDTLVKLGL